MLCAEDHMWVDWRVRPPSKVVNEPTVLKVSSLWDFLLGSALVITKGRGAPGCAAVLCCPGGAARRGELELFPINWNT